MKKTLVGFALLGAFMVPAQADAAPVQYWDFLVTSEWQTADTVWNAGNGTTTNTAPLLSWGATGGNHLNAAAAPGSARSALEISESPAMGTMETNGPAELTNVVTHYNNAISNTFASLRSGTLLTNLTLFESGNPLPFGDLTFSVAFTETPNVSGACAEPSVSVCDDIFVLNFSDFSFDFTYLDGITYTVFIGEATDRIGPLSDAQCIAANVATGCFGLTTPEGQFTPVAFNIRIAAVPEPATMLLMGIGLIGAAGVVRRRRA